MPTQQNDASASMPERMPSKNDALLYHQILARTELPTLGGPVMRVVQLTSSDQQALPQLASAILNDVALTQKVLRMANTAAYHTGAGGPVSTISKAIYLLGFEKVRSTALAMMVVDRFATAHTPGVQFELQRALCASVIARELAAASSWRDSEEAAVAALFRNLGRLMVASYSEKLYGEIEAVIDSGAALPARASAQAIGCSHDELGQIVLREWQMPESVVQAVATLPNGPVTLARTRQQWLQQVASFSMLAGACLTRLYEPGSEELIARLQARYGEALELSLEDLHELLKRMRNEADLLSLNAQLDLHTLAPPAAPPAAPNPAPDVAGSPSLPEDLLMPAIAPPTPGQRHPSGKPVNADVLLLAGVEDLAGTIAAGGVKSTALLSQMLEIFYASLGFRFAAVCLADARGTGMRARIAFGEHAQARMASFAFELTDKGSDLFSVALARDADVFVPDTTEARVQAMLPEWHRKRLPEVRSMMLLPLQVQGKPFGLVYGERGRVAPEGLSGNETGLVRTLKAQVLRALKRAQ